MRLLNGRVRGYGGTATGKCCSIKGRVVSKVTASDKKQGQFQLIGIGQAFGKKSEEDSG